ncbi:sulfotransferase family protein [Planctomycetota bacterium]
MTKRDYLTIVSGIPRSGTSMMMQMIDAGGIPALTDHVRRADENNPKGYYEFEPVKNTKQDPRWIEQGVGKVVKMVHLLLYDLPPGRRYRVVLMRRRLDDVVRSQNKMLERSGQPSDDLPPDRLIYIYRTQLEDVRRYLEANSQTFRTIEVDYNEVLADPASPAQQVSRFLDGLDAAQMIAVVDPANDIRWRQPDSRCP